MTYLLSIDEAIDRKFLVTKSVKGQAEAGTIIHVMDAEKAPNNSIVVYYRVARFNQKFHDYQDFTAKFEDLSQFCKWVQPDNFIARNYESFSIKDIQHYIKIKKRTFASFCLPLILLAAVIIWGLSLYFMEAPISIIIASVLTVFVIVAIFSMFRTQKRKEKLRMYKKISTGWGVVIE